MADQQPGNPAAGAPEDGTAPAPEPTRIEAAGPPTYPVRIKTGPSEATRIEPPADPTRPDQQPFQPADPTRVDSTSRPADPTRVEAPSQAALAGAVQPADPTRVEAPSQAALAGAVQPADPTRAEPESRPASPAPVRPADPTRAEGGAAVGDGGEDRGKAADAAVTEEAAPARWSGSAAVPEHVPKPVWWSRRRAQAAAAGPAPAVDPWEGSEDWSATPAVDPWADQDTPWQLEVPFPEAMPPTRIDSPLPPTRRDAALPPTRRDAALPPTRSEAGVAPTRSEAGQAPTPAAAPMPPTRAAAPMPSTRVEAGMPPTRRERAGLPPAGSAAPEAPGRAGNPMPPPGRDAALGAAGSRPGSAPPPAASAPTGPPAESVEEPRRRGWGRRKRAKEAPAPAGRLPVQPRPATPPAPPWVSPNLPERQAQKAGKAQKTGKKQKSYGPPAPPPAQRRPLPPPRRKRRWPRRLFLFTVLSAVCCCGVPGYYLWPAAQQYPVSASLPQSVADLDLRDDGAGRRAVERLSDQLGGTSLVQGEVFSGAYADGDGKRVTLFGTTGLRFTPEDDVEAEIAHLSGGYDITNVEAYDLGETGVHERCGVGRSGGNAVVVCAWADHGSLATVVTSRRSVAESAELTGVLRSAVLTRG